MNITLTTDEIANLSRIYTFYRTEKQEASLPEEEDCLLHDMLQRIGLLEGHEPNSLHTLALTPHGWWLLRDFLAAEILTWENSFAAVPILLDYRVLLRKLDTYELAAHVEKALTDEPISESV